MIMKHKKAQGLPVKTIIGIIVGISVMVLAFIIYSNINKAPNEAISNQVQATPNTYDQLFNAGSFAGPICYVPFSKTPLMQLASGINSVCWTPPAIYGKESENSDSVGYVSPSYACPAGQLIGKVNFSLELMDANDEISITSMDENGMQAYIYPVTGTEFSSNNDKEVNLHGTDAGEPLIYPAKYIQFVLITKDHETVSHNAYEFAGIKVKSIECMTPSFDLVPLLSISPTTIDNTNAAKDGSATIKYGYWTRGNTNTICNPGDDREIVHLAIMNLLNPRAQPITDQFVMQNICGEKQEKAYIFKPGTGGLYRVEVYVDYVNGQYGGIIPEADETNNQIHKNVISTKEIHTITLDATTAPIKHSEARDKYSSDDNYVVGFPSECYAGDGFNGRAGKYIITPGSDEVTLGGSNGKSIKTDKIYGYIGGGNAEYHADIFSKYPPPITETGNEYYFKQPGKYYLELNNNKGYLCGWFKDIDNKKNNNAGTNTLRIDVLE